MHIIFFAQRIFPPRIEGIQNNTVLLTKHLISLCRVDIISHASLTHPEPISHINNVTVHHFFPLSDNPYIQLRYSFLWTLKTLRFFKKNRPSILCFQYLETSFIIPMFFIACIYPSIKYILVIYSTDEVQIRYKRIVLKLLRKKFSSVVIISPYLQQKVESLWFTPHQIVSIPLSFDKTRYSHLADFNQRKKKTILFSAGTDEKAWSILMVNLAKLMPEYTFIFAMRKFNTRSEREFSILTKYISTTQVKNITMLRNIGNMETLLWEVSALVFPLQDIHVKMLIPVALLEAMARWTLCFVSDLPNLQLLVSDQKNAIVFDRYNVHDLKNKIETYIHREDIAHEAYAFWKHFPDYTEIASQYFTLFTSA